MTPVGAISKFLGIAVACAAFLSATSAQAAMQQNQAEVRSVRGTANYTTDRGANWKKLNVGMKLNQSSVIRTAPGSLVDLYMGDNGPVVRVTENTTMGIDRLTVDRSGAEKVIETQLDLRNGRILGNVRKLAQASKYEVKTPQGVAGIRGTKYDISADGRVTVLEGTVVVVYMVGNQPSTATVGAGQTSLPPTAAGGPVRITTETPVVLDPIRREIDSIGRGPVTAPGAATPTIILTKDPIVTAPQGGDTFKIIPIEALESPTTGG